VCKDSLLLTSFSNVFTLFYFIFILFFPLKDAISILGGFIGAMRIPERWFPGRFDFFFNSHHIMHVLVLVAVVQMHYASKLDLIWLSDPQCYPRGGIEPLLVVNSTPDPAEL
jgi:predicted membrane channel-forming protein YqfA (hemolysin III family)